MSDIITHRAGYSSDNDNVGIAKYRADEMIDGILRDTEASEFRLFLSDSAENNFRYQIDPTYKANRVAPKPVHLEDLKEHLIVRWGARIAHGMEADDALGINQHFEWVDFGMACPKPEGAWFLGSPMCPEAYGTTVVCSIDKDLLQIPGLHYNFVKKEKILVTPEDGLLSFYRSILIGDVADNIKGVYGIGPAKAAKILPKWESEHVAVAAIVGAYMAGLYVAKFGKKANQIYPGLEKEAKDIIRRNGQLLKIKQSEEEPNWDSQYLALTEELPAPSIPKTEAVSSPSTEPTTPATMSSVG